MERLEASADDRIRELYQSTLDWLSDSNIQQEIDEQFPAPEVQRRNTGYALDALLNTTLFGRGSAPFNFSKLIAGSEGTLMMVTEMTLQCQPLPPNESLLVCPHFNLVSEALRATEVALKYSPYRVS